jgi:cytochrome c
MKRYFFSVSLVLALVACQAEEPKQSPPAINETVPTATQSETAPSAPVQKAVEKASSMINEAGVQAKQAMKEPLAEAAQVKEELGNKLAGSSVAEPVAEPAPAAPKPTPDVKQGSGDAAKGMLVARKCAVCHNFDSKNKMGPGLAGIFGREAGSVSGFGYKFTAFILPGKAWRWDEAHMSAWVCDSPKAVKSFTGDDSAKTKMGAQRICDPAAQADLNAFLKTL